MMREFEIERQFGIKIESIKPNKGVYFLKTDRGNKCLKKVNYGIQKLLFVYGAKEHLRNNGFNQVDKNDLNVDGTSYAVVNEDIYTLSEWIEGRECEILSDSAYLELCKKAEQDKNFCHHDYTYHNIIVDDNDNVHVIDFDYCKREVRVYDISNFLIKVLKRVDWDIEYAKTIIEAYDSVSPIEEEEYKVLYAFLVFPQRFWRLSNRFYYNEVNWGQKIFDRKINDLINEREKFINFIEEFRKIYIDKE